MTSILMRLGLVLTGTNEDLLPPPPKDDDDGKNAPGEGSEEGEDKDEESEGSEGSADDETPEEDDSEDEEEAGGGSASDEDDSDEDEGTEEPVEGSDSDDSKDEDEADGSPESDEDDSEDEPSTGSSDADDSEDEDDDSDEGDADDSKDEKPEGSDDDGSSSDSSETDAAPGQDAGGFSEDDPEAEGIAESLLEAMEKGGETDLLDNNEALAEAIEGEVEGDGPPLDVDEGVWRPYRPEGDVLKIVAPTDASRAAAARMRHTVKDGVSFLRNKLRSKFLQARTPQVIHGVRNGRDLSERRMVSSFVELKAGRRPERPDWMKQEKEECSLACAIVLDESGSMSSLVAAVGQAAMAVAEPLDTLGSPCLVIGPRNGGKDYQRSYESPTSEELYEPLLDEAGSPVMDHYGQPKSRARFHRVDSVIIDVFKGWEEPFNRCVDRFGRLQAVGSTPLEDGIQYALQELSDRKERHRIVLVVTDGCPDHADVVRRQIRLAAKAGVHVVGVGIDSGCYQVKELFPEHVCVYNIKDLPKELLKVLEGIMFPKNGKRVELDGKFKKRSSIRD